MCKYPQTNKEKRKKGSQKPSDDPDLYNLWNYLKFLLECAKWAFLHIESRLVSALRFRHLAWEGTREVVLCEIDLKFTSGLKRLAMSSSGYLFLLFLVAEERGDFERTIVDCFEEKGGMFSLLSFSQIEMIAIVNKIEVVVEWEGQRELEVYM